MGKIWAAFALIMCMQGATKIVSGDFGKTREGAPTRIYTLTNKSGVEVKITNYGGRVVSLKVPDKKGAMGDVVLGFDALDGYLAENPYFGALIGRYANRIGHAQFTLDGALYKVPKNDGDNSLHGGIRGFDKVVWTSRDLPDGGLELTYLSKDGEEGYPGNCKVTVVYHLTDANELKIEYAASTDKDTVVNLTNHSYFNLAGGGDVLGHMLTLHADRFTPVDGGLIPTGELKAVEGTPFDFRKATAIGARIEQNDQQLKLGKGYDHNWVLNKRGAELSLAARVEEPSTGRVMEVWTTQPGIQFYTGNFLDGTIKGKGGTVYARRSALCLETQHFPDSPNKPKFPSTVLKPGMEFKSTTVYKFVR
ncbi:MAG TPA: aldose epimerase family protein [Bryobacteraceae bacterium]|jgi:aldose 1-epimerase|nr:aldose epimerase family protein [Bryobacteraceae bacterium]